MFGESTFSSLLDINNNHLSAKYLDTFYRRVKVFKFYVNMAARMLCPEINH